MYFRYWGLKFSDLSSDTCDMLQVIETQVSRPLKAEKFVYFGYCDPG